MKAKVYVNLKSGVLDPQGKAIQHSVELLGFSGISDVRQGKYFEISLDGSLDNERARESIEKMAREVLLNPIIEDYRVQIEAGNSELLFFPDPIATTMPTTSFRSTWVSRWTSSGIAKQIFPRTTP